MGIPIDDDPIEPTDDATVIEQAPPQDIDRLDPEAPTADALDQEREVTPGWRIGRRSADPEAPDGDALDQATSVPDDDGENWGQ